MKKRADPAMGPSDVRPSFIDTHEWTEEENTLLFQRLNIVSCQPRGLGPKANLMLKSIAWMEIASGAPDVATRWLAPWCSSSEAAVRGWMYRLSWRSWFHVGPSGSTGRVDWDLLALERDPAMVALLGAGLDERARRRGTASP